MADNEIQARAPEPVTISVLRARNLRGVKGDVVLSSVKVEFRDKVLGESPKVECTAETPAEFNYNAVFNCTFEDAALLDELSFRPVILTVTELLPKEKKQKEEKTQVLGQVTFDLLPLVKGQLKHQYTLRILPVPGSPLEQVPLDNTTSNAELDVQISVQNGLVSEATMKENNLISITVESLYNVPESFTTNGPQGGYTAAVPVPFSAERDSSVVFTGGSVKAANDKDPYAKAKKWIIPGSAQGAAVYIPNSVISSGGAYEDEDGDFKGKEDRDLRVDAEAEKNRVVWNLERRCYMQTSAVKCFQEKIAKTRVWPVEVFRLAAATGGKGKKDDDASFGFHGIAYVNLSPLLYPGVNRIRGAYKVYPFVEADFQEKTKRRTGLAEEASRIANGIMHNGPSSPVGKRAEKGADKKTEKKAAKAATTGGAGAAGVPPTAEESATEAAEGFVNVEGMQYAEARSYVMLEIRLERPLVPKREPEEMAQRVAAYIPPRQTLTKRGNSADKAVEDYHSQVAEISTSILEEFRETFTDLIRNGEIPSSPEAIEEMRMELMYNLNSSGKYYAFKEQLKYAVIKIVREKFLQTQTLRDQEQLQLFLRDLFIYLVDELQTGLGRVISLQERTPIPPPVADSQQLAHFAREAEVNENQSLAAHYYQERIARDRNNPEHWYDYGIYCLGQGDFIKAESCLQECIAINQRHTDGLIVYGIIAALLERHEEADTFLEAATAHDPSNVIAWTVRGLFYDALGNDIGAEMAFLEASKMAAAENAPAPPQAGDEGQIEGKPATEESGPAPDTEHPSVENGGPPIALPAAAGSSPTGAGTAPRSSSNQGGSSDRTTRRNMQPTAAQQQSRGSIASRGGAVSSNKPPRLITPQQEAALAAAAAAAGPGTTGSGGPIDSSGAGGTAAAGEVQPGGPGESKMATSIFLRAAQFLLQVKAYSFVERSLAHELVVETSELSPRSGTGAPGAVPKPEYHLLHAKLRLSLKQFEEAERSLTEALQIEFQNPEAWAHLGHLKYLVGDVQAARDCFERTLVLVCEPKELHPILLRLASIYLQDGRYKEAKNTFLLACKRSPSCISWLGAGIACYRLSELADAEDALAEANILNNKDPEVWAYLSLICLRTSRKVEAEQSFKYAVKCGLSDPTLMEELRSVQTEVGFGDPQLA